MKRKAKDKRTGPCKLSFEQLLMTPKRIYPMLFSRVGVVAVFKITMV